MHTRENITMQIHMDGKKRRFALLFAASDLRRQVGVSGNLKVP